MIAAIPRGVSRFSEGRLAGRAGTGTGRRFSTVLTAEVGSRGAAEVKALNARVATTERALKESIVKGMWGWWVC